MSLDLQTALKAAGGKFAARAIQTFDRATMVVVATCWGAAVLMMAFALYTVSLSASTKRAAEMAAAAEPLLPQIVRKPLEVKDSQQLVNRLQHRYEGISFVVEGANIAITTADGSKFRDWLDAVGYLDTAAPQYRWAIREFCVGKCVGNALMRAVLGGEKIAFEASQAGQK